MLIKIFLKILIYYNYLLNYIDLLFINHLTYPLNFVHDCIYLLNIIYSTLRCATLRSFLLSFPIHSVLGCSSFSSHTLSLSLSHSLTFTPSLHRNVNCITFEGHHLRPADHPKSKRLGHKSVASYNIYLHCFAMCTKLFSGFTPNI